MWETVAIIVALGGLEFTLWLLNRRAAKKDHDMQRKQLEILDGILTELAIQNSEDVHNTGLPRAGGEVRDEGAGNTNEDRAKEHPVCN